MLTPRTMQGLEGLEMGLSSFQASQPQHLPLLSLWACLSPFSSSSCYTIIPRETQIKGQGFLKPSLAFSLQGGWRLHPLFYLSLAKMLET